MKLNINIRTGLMVLYDHGNSFLMVELIIKNDFGVRLQIYHSNKQKQITVSKLDTMNETEG